MTLAATIAALIGHPLTTDELAHVRSLKRVRPDKTVNFEQKHDWPRMVGKNRVDVIVYVPPRKLTKREEARERKRPTQE